MVMVTKWAMIIESYICCIKNISLEKELEIAKKKIALLKDENEILYQLLQT